ELSSSFPFPLFTNHPNNLLKELNKCRLSETMCDVTILVGSRSFAAHKAVLACAAGYFQNLFLNTGLDAARTYVVDFITPANFEKILSFVYTSELFTDLINVGVIYEVAERLGMEDLLKACPLSSTSSEQKHSLSEIRSGGEHFGPERNYILHGEVAGSYKEDDRNTMNEASQTLPLMHQQPPKTEQESEQGQFAPATSMATQPNLGSVNVALQTTTSSCHQYKVQSNGDYSKEQGFGQMDELQLEDLGDDELHFEDASEELGPTEEVIELSDDSEEELAFENDSRDSKAMPCQVSSPSGSLPSTDEKGCLTITSLSTPATLSRGRSVCLVGGLAQSWHALPAGSLWPKISTLSRHLNLCSLMWHTLSHLGISVFSCSVCANSFVDRHLLEKHLAVHQNMEEALFRCHFCGQSFKLEAAYRYHVSQHKCGGSLDIRPSFGDRLQQQGLQKRKLPEEFLSEDLALCWKRWMSESSSVAEACVNPSRQGFDETVALTPRKVSLRRTVFSAKRIAPSRG
uniref:Zinc finger and BTB domain containing 39 n=1 Tax=Apteryx owenii TaxID=8824 RepID=A0A8B9QSF7_APTOW